MNKRERAAMVKAMEFLARNINDEDVFYMWLSEGVADGDINYMDLDIDNTDDCDIDYYLDDITFGQLMETFLYVMAKAKRSGGLYCDDITS